MQAPPARTAEITAEFTIPGITCIHGVTFDGTHVWFAAGPGDDIHCVDPATGALVKSFGRTDCNAGLAFDGRHLWQIASERIDCIDRATGKTLRTIRSDRLVTGVTWAGAELWHGTYPEDENSIEPGELREIDPESGAVRQSVHLPAGTLVSGTEFDGRGRIWLGSLERKKATLRAVRKP
jgi:outer membrane protein assembly factor BamB